MKIKPRYAIGSSTFQLVILTYYGLAVTTEAESVALERIEEQLVLRYNQQT
jgi:hypothetical protein